MPNCTNNIHNEQWDMCGQCGFFFPISSLTKQKGLLICHRRTCFDNLDIERHSWMIQQVMNEPVYEGSDMRQVDKGYFEGYDEVNY